MMITKLASEWTIDHFWLATSAGAYIGKTLINQLNGATLASTHSQVTRAYNSVIPTTGVFCLVTQLLHAAYLILKLWRTISA